MKRCPRTGYLLLTVVIMVAVASLMLARMTATSLRVASVAIREERDVRHRWASLSLRRFSLNAAPSLLASRRLAANDRTTPADKPLLWRNVDLAGQQWKVIVADESAKLNLKHASRRHDEQAVRRTMESLFSGQVSVRPSSKLGDAINRRAVRWELWLESRMGTPLTSPRAIASATQRLTLSGDGRLNVCRCEAETLDVLWRQLFGRMAPPVLHEIRHQRPPPTSEQLIRTLALRESQALIASEWLTTESHCFSVWVFCQSDRRVPSSLYVEWGGRDARKQYRGYEY